MIEVKGNDGWGGGKRRRGGIDTSLLNDLQHANIDRGSDTDTNDGPSGRLMPTNKL